MKAATETAGAPDARDERREQMSHEHYTFRFFWTDGRQKTWEGTFTTKILTLAEQAKVAAAHARLNSGLPQDAIPEGTNRTHAALAHMIHSLVDVPKWAVNLLDLHDPLLILRIYEEVAELEATFLGYIDRAPSREGPPA